MKLMALKDDCLRYIWNDVSAESYGADVPAGMFRGHRHMRVPPQCQMHLPPEQQVLSPTPTEQVLELDDGNVK